MSIGNIVFSRSCLFARDRNRKDEIQSTSSIKFTNDVAISARCPHASTPACPPSVLLNVGPETV